MPAPSEAPLPPRIVVGVAGGIAAYKAVSLVRDLVKRGASVTVVPTHSALKFVGLPTWEAVSRNPVTSDLFDHVAEVRHVALGQQADLVIIAPATANQIANMAAGLAGDLLGTTLLATQAPVVIAPAMHTEMWEHPSVTENIAILESRGVHVVGPASGELTGGDHGVGRMSEPADIAQFAWTLLQPPTMAGKKVVVSAGGTREPLDPVRFLGNRSSGEMGVEIAQAAAARGAEVILVAAHLEVPRPRGMTVVEAQTAESMREAMLTHSADASMVVMAAAVADWVAQSVSEEKLSKKNLGETWSPTLVRTPDILAELGLRSVPGQTVVGFAAETHDSEDDRLAAAQEKLSVKNADVIVLNQVGVQIGFGPVRTAVTLIFSASPQSLTFEGTKHSVAGLILDALLDR